MKVNHFKIFWSVFVKSFREARRDGLALALTLSFAPFFVILYAAAFSNAYTANVIVINNDQPVQTSAGTFAAGDALVEKLRGYQFGNSMSGMTVLMMDDQAQAEARMRNREMDLMLIIPPDFSARLLALKEEGAGQNTAGITFGGDLTNSRYSIASIFVLTVVDQYIQTVSGIQSTLQYNEIAIGDSANRSDFELAVPGMLVFAVILLIFLASITIAREIESGAFNRLKITRMNAVDYLGGLTLALALVGIVGVLLALVTAWLFGFRSEGSMLLAFLICVVTSLSIIGTGLIVACWSKNVTQAFLLANFPLGIYMFFSGSMFALPKVILFRIGDVAVNLYDILPPTHAVNALNKIFIFGAGPQDMIYELLMLVVLSLLFFGIGVAVFYRRQMRAV